MKLDCRTRSLEPTQDSNGLSTDVHGLLFWIFQFLVEISFLLILLIGWGLIRLRRWAAVGGKFLGVISLLVCLWFILTQGMEHGPEPYVVIVALPSSVHTFCRMEVQNLRPNRRTPTTEWRGRDALCKCQRHLGAAIGVSLAPRVRENGDNNISFRSGIAELRSLWLPILVGISIVDLCGGLPSHAIHTARARPWFAYWLSADSAHYRAVAWTFGMKLTVRPLTPDLRPALEDLFDKHGACNGCWCMYWRIGSAYRKTPREKNKSAFRELVRRGPPPGLLAFDGDVSVGWCQLTPRSALQWLDGTWTLARVDDMPVWSISCFYVRRGYRKQGVMSVLIAAALKAARRAKAPALEAYPVDTDAPKSTSNLFTGTASTF